MSPSEKTPPPRVPTQAHDPDRIDPDVQEPVVSEQPSRPTVIALCAGASLWFGHFMGVYLLAEVACEFDLLGRQVLGMSVLSALILASTVLALGVIGWAAQQTVSYRRSGGGDDTILAIGLGLDALFAFAVVATGLPVLWLQPC